MSHKATAWAIDQSLPSLQKLVLIMLADRHNKDTGRCDPSIGRLADDCGMSKDAVRSALSKLCDAGLLTVNKRSDGERQLSNYYVLHFDVEASKGSSSEPPPPFATPTGVVAQADRGSSSDRLGVVAETDPNHVIQPVIEPGKKPVSEPERVSAPPKPPSSLPFLASTGAAKPVSQTVPDIGDLVRKIVCAHPKAILRSWSPDEVPYSDLTNAIDAIDAERVKAGCTHAEAGAFILERVTMLAEKIPRGEWRYLKPPGDFFRLREYRMEPEEFIRSAPSTSPQQTFAEAAHAREQEEIRAARERRANRG